MSPMYNPYAVSNGTPTDPLEVFKLPPNVIQAIQQAAKGLTVNINQPKPGSSASSAPKLPGQNRPAPPPPPPPLPPPQGIPQGIPPTPVPSPIGTTLDPPTESAPSTVHYPGIPGNPGDPSNDPNFNATSTVTYPGSTTTTVDPRSLIGAGGNPMDPTQLDPNSPIGNPSDSPPGYWSQDPSGNPTWVDTPGSDPFSGGDNYGMGWDPAAGFNGPGDPNSPLSQLGNAMYGGDYSEGGGGGGSNLNEASAADYNYFDE